MWGRFVHSVGGGEGYFFPKSSLHQASGSLQRARSGRPRRSWESTQCSSSVPPAGLGGGDKEPAGAAAARIQSGRKTQHSMLRGDVTFTQPLTCHGLPGTHSPPFQSGGRSPFCARSGGNSRPGKKARSLSVPDFFQCAWSPQ